ncbi:hypothetical protein [Owenweeksia hongkongensis]|uniref:hypothetical protein n=1 Tax=Owenweeksia hongkongensis TaxID=253245 RepID=UPI003A8E2D23
MRYSSKFDQEVMIGFPILAIVGGSILFLVLDSYQIGTITAAVLGIVAATGVMLTMLFDIKRLTIDESHIEFETVFGTQKFDLSDVKEIWDYSHWSLYARRLLIIHFKNGKKVQVKEARDNAFEKLKENIQKLDWDIEFKKIKK